VDAEVERVEARRHPPEEGLGPRSTRLAHAQVVKLEPGLAEEAGGDAVDEPGAHALGDSEEDVGGGGGRQHRILGGEGSEALPQGVTPPHERRDPGGAGSLPPPLQGGHASHDERAEHEQEEEAPAAPALLLRLCG
jgi:hypothetical protein